MGIVPVLLGFYLRRGLSDYLVDAVGLLADFADTVAAPVSRDAGLRSDSSSYENGQASSVSRFLGFLTDSGEDSIHLSAFVGNPFDRVEGKQVILGQRF